MPLPRFWYLPRGEKAVVVMSGDDHSPTQAAGGTASNFDRFKALSPRRLRRRQLGLRPLDVVHVSQQRLYQRPGGRVRRGRLRGRRSIRSSAPARRRRSRRASSARSTTRSSRSSGRSTRACPRRSRAARTASSGPTGPRTRRSSSRAGSAWTRTTTTIPGSWIGAKTGFMNGGGFPMRFADLDGTPIDVYQPNTNMTDETTTALPAAIDTLLDNAVGPSGYYGAFGTNMHTDNAAPHPGAETIVAAAQARSVPVISYKQMLDWVGRPQQLDDPRPELERRNAHLRHDGRRRRERAADDAPDPGPDRHPERAHVRRLATSPTRSRRSRASSTPCSRRDRHLPGDLLVDLYLAPVG